MSDAPSLDEIADRLSQMPIDQRRSVERVSERSDRFDWLPRPVAALAALPQVGLLFFRTMVDTFRRTPDWNETLRLYGSAVGANRDRAAADIDTVTRRLLLFGLSKAPDSLVRDAGR